MIFTRKLFWLVALAVFMHTVVAAQRETKIDLRQRGRIIAGSSMTFLLTDEDEKKKQTSDLRKKLADRKGLRAVVVPDKQIEKKYLIGLISYDGLPYDEEVSQSDFSYLQAYAGSAQRAAVTEKYEEITVAVAVGAEIGPKIAEINAIVVQSSATDSVKLYAGFLLSDLTEPRAVAEVKELVDNYRRRTERNLEVIINALLNNQPNPWVKPFRFRFGDAAESLTVNDLVGGEIVRSSAGSKTPYLMLWHKRSLVIVPEKPDVRFDLGEYGAVKNYVLRVNPSFSSDMMVPAKKVGTL